MRRGMEVTVLIICLAITCGSAVAATRDGLTLVEKGASEYRIVVPREAGPAVKYAAEELQRWLAEMSGAKLPIVTDAAAPVAREIVLGESARLAEAGVKVDFAALGREGYVLRTAGRRLIIAGGKPRGTLYGVYGLLTDHLGCRWFTPTVSHIPQRKTVQVPELDERTIPVLEYREPFVKDCFDGDWCARNRVNSSRGTLTEKHGGKVRFVRGKFVHTFGGLVPVRKYFDEHPEYFSEVNGKRIAERTQLCCTNEEVIAIVTRGVLEAFRKDPDGFVCSVSQNDWGNWCRCAECSALSEREGSRIAPVLHLVNRVAAAVEKEFPDKAVETLAYQWSRKPPRTMRPRKNVIIRLCSIECCFSHPLATCDHERNRSFVRDLEGWSQISERLWVWDYVTSFRHYWVPFPNLRVRGDNIRLFVKNNVKGIFEQDIYNTEHGELSPLSGYLGARLLWDPDYGEDRAIDEFLAGVYGPAAQPIRAYLDLLHEKVEEDNIHMRIWQGPHAKYLTDEILWKSNELWDQAELAVAEKAEVLGRVREARLSADYAFIYCMLARAKPEVTPELKRAVERFFAVAEKLGIDMLSEHRGHNWDVKRFRAWVAARMKERQ